MSTNVLTPLPSSSCRDHRWGPEAFGKEECVDAYETVGLSPQTRPWDGSGNKDLRSKLLMRWLHLHRQPWGCCRSQKKSNRGIQNSTYYVALLSGINSVIVTFILHVRSQIASMPVMFDILPCAITQVLSS